MGEEGADVRYASVQERLCACTKVGLEQPPGRLWDGDRATSLIPAWLWGPVTSDLGSHVDSQRIDTVFDRLEGPKAASGNAVPASVPWQLQAWGAVAVQGWVGSRRQYGREAARIP